MDPIYSLKLPPKSYRRTIEELSVTIPDPVVKLKFLKQAINEYQKISSQGNLKPSITEIAFQKKLLDNAEELWPGSKKAAKTLICKDVITAPDIKSRWVHKLRYVIGSAILMLIILGVGSAFSPLVQNLGAPINRNSQQTKPTIAKIIIRKPVIYAQPSNGQDKPPSSIVKSANYQKSSYNIPIYLQNPILVTLTSQRTINSTSDRIRQNPIFSSHLCNGEDSPTSSKVMPAIYQNPTGLVLKYFQNPMLSALTYQKAINTKSDSITQKPSSLSRPPASENHSSSPTVISAKRQYETEPVLKHLQNPILLALTLHKNKNSKADRFSDKPLVTSVSLDNRNHAPAVIVKPKNYHKETGRSLKFLQNPILLALTSRQSKSIKTGPISNKPLVASLRLDSRNHTPAVIVEPGNYQIETGRVLKFLQNPILLALLSQKTINTKSDRTTGKPLFSSLPLNSQKHSSSAIVKLVNYQIEPVQIPEYLQHPIWLVEKTSDREIYSNRLQIITTQTISNLPREYYRFPKNSNFLPVNSKITDKVSGIVFHASESDLYPFMPQMNRSILKYSKQLIKFLLRKKSYHFFIDRFGRVYRLVREDHAAFHAGNSIWADDKEIFLNLNHAFLGICFEGKGFEEISIRKKKRGQSANSKSTRLKPTGISSFNEAQLRSGKELTDWLRIKYNIPQHNCVPHALTSVNPDRMLIGFHLDLSRGFPFARFGLSNKYQEPLPSIVEFGFLHDRYFEKIFNGELWHGIRYAEEILQRQAKNSGMSFAKYRKSLRQRFSRYREWNKEMLEKKDPTDIKPPQGSLTAAQN